MAKLVTLKATKRYTGHFPIQKVKVADSSGIQRKL